MINVNPYIFGSSTPIIPPGLIFYTRNNNEVVDETGNSTPTTNGITFANGIFTGIANRAVLFNADSDNIQVPDSSLWSFGNGLTDKPFSISFEFNINTLDSIFNWFFTKRNTSTGLDRNFDVRVDNNTGGGKMYFQLMDESLAGSIIALGSTVISENVNYTCTVVYGGGGVYSDMDIIINGVLETKSNISTGSYVAMEDFTTPININGLAHIPNYQINGRLGQVAIWDKKLTVSEALIVHNDFVAGTFLM